MTRSSAPEHALRINAALELIKEFDSPAKAAVVLAGRFGISRSQAYRYLRKAGAMSVEIPIPEPKVPFTVKLSPDLVQAIRQYALSTEKTLGEVVTQAVETFIRGDLGRG
jgi:hypothetical protein